jgi:predicted DsbA family dithiol-disulfide isomerase
MGRIGLGRSSRWKLAFADALDFRQAQALVARTAIDHLVRMTKPLTIDFISDVVCPWCVIGLRELETALDRLKAEADPVFRFQPFELNPTMPPQGQKVAEHIQEKYGSTPDQAMAGRSMIKNRADQVGFTMNTSGESRIYNTFDAHRLLHWAGLKGKQIELKRALFDAYFTKQLNVSDREVLVATAEAAGLDAAEAREVLESGRYGEHVRAAEQAWHQSGIGSVPSIVINERYMISGGQPAEVFEKALRRILAEA